MEWMDPENWDDDDREYACHEIGTMMTMNMHVMKLGR